MDSHINIGMSLTMFDCSVIGNYSVACQQKKNVLVVLPVVLKTSLCNRAHYWNVEGNWRTQRKSTHGKNMDNPHETDSGVKPNTCNTTLI